MSTVLPAPRAQRKSDLPGELASPEERAAYQAAEEGGGSHAARLNWLRAAVLGANDGIVSTAGIVIGVAGATTNATTIATAGIAGLAAGALSMAVGEYVSVSTQRDSEKALLDKERHELATMPEEELLELAGLYEAKGLSPDLAFEVAEQLHAHDALGAHAEAELGIDPDDLTNPMAAAIASAVAFTVGALLPLLFIVLSPPAIRVPLTVAAVSLGLLLTGFASAKVGRMPVLAPMLRNIAGGLLAMGITFGIGHLVGTTIA